MTSIRVPWGAWYGDSTLDLPLPETWRVSVPDLPHVPALTPEELRSRLRQPIGMPSIGELAAGKRSAVIVVDDLSRPTPTAQILPLVLEVLDDAGIARDSIHILVGLGGHRPLTRADLLHKLGPLADDLAVSNHTPYENLVFAGTTSTGTPVWINRWYVEAEFRLTIGCVEPHPAMGFSGGAKLVFPGLAGIDSIYANHRPHGLGRGLLSPETNAMRHDAEEAVRLVGLDAIINVVVAGGRQIAGLFAGDFIAAHRTAAAFATRLYQTPVAGPADVVIFNAYPKDTELIQVNNALNAALAARLTGTPLLREGGAVVVLTAASEGAGYHALASPGGRMYERPPHPFLVGSPVYVYCPHGRAADLPPSLPRGSILCRKWQPIVEDIMRRLGPDASVLVFKEGPLQIPVPAESPNQE